MTRTFMNRRIRWIGGMVLLANFGLSGCATQAVPYDYTAFKASKPASMLVLPPVNETSEIKGSYGVLSQVTLPLAEAGYYVVPVSLMDETFRQNGFSNPEEIQNVSAQKLREIFGADAAVYIKIKQYGTVYTVLTSETRVTVEGRIVDLRSGDLLWQGAATASSAESNNSSQGGLVGMLVKAVVNQIVGSVSDASFQFAGSASQRLLLPRPNGVLPGPRSPLYGVP